MVISVFPDYGQAIDRYRSTRSERLERQAQDAQQAAYNRMLAGVPEDQRPMYEVLGPEQGVAMMLQNQQGQSERMAEAREAQLSFLQEEGQRFAEARASQGENFDEGGFLRGSVIRASDAGIPLRDPQSLQERVRTWGQGYTVAPGGDNSTEFERLLQGLSSEEQQRLTRARAEYQAGLTRRPGGGAIDTLASALANQIAPVSGSGDDGAEAARAVLRFSGSTGNYRRLVEEAGPSAFGVAGAGRRVAQQISQQFLSASGVDLQQLQAEALGLARSGENPDPELQDRVRSMFDPALSTLGPAAVLLAYQAAEAIAQQSGRGLSDKDFANFLNVLGDPTSVFSTYDGTLARLNRLDEEVVTMVNAERAVADLPIIPRGLSFSEGSAQEWINAAPGSERAAVVDQYTGENQETPSSSESAPANGEPRTGRRRWVHGQGFVEN